MVGKLHRPQRRSTLALLRSLSRLRERVGVRESRIRRRQRLPPSLKFLWIRRRTVSNPRDRLLPELSDFAAASVDEAADTSAVPEWRPHPTLTRKCGRGKAAKANIPDPGPREAEIR